MNVNLQIIAKNLNLHYDNDLKITGLNTLKDATKTEVSFLENKKYLVDLKNTNAAAVFISKEFKDQVPKDTLALVCDVPYEALAITSKLFAPILIETNGNQPIIGHKSHIMNNVHIGLNTIIGNNCTIMSGVFIGDNVTIGDNCTIYPNITIYRDCIIGNDVMIHAGTVIGSDGFGFATTKDGKHIKIYQNGNVIIGNNVEIGANCTIDRGAFASTIIEDLVRIDNLVHIGHNCKIGIGCIFAGQAGLSGSSILNEYVVMAGQSATTGHLEIAPFTTISGRGVVSKSITQPKKQWAGFPLMEHRTWLKLQGKLARLLK
jgi:UDP-3-O-[3-hydroxymyristoyl] glucosamine N-acyltransferase